MALIYSIIYVDTERCCIYLLLSTYVFVFFVSLKVFKCLILLITYLRGEMYKT